MTISSSLSAGVAGLTANASRLATISDNIANSATYGYKRAVSDFHSMVASGNGSVYSAGGVRTTTERMVDQRGPITSTSNPTDLAVRGRGMIPVTTISSIRADGALAPKLVTTGSFRTNNEGYLTTSGGLALLGWPANEDGTIPTYPKDTFDGLDPVRVDANRYVGQATTEISFKPTLPADETKAGASGDARQLSVEYFDNLASSESLNIEFVPVVPATGQSNQWTMNIRDSASGGAIIGEYTITFDNTTATGMRLLNVTLAGAGGAYDPATGKLTVTAARGPIEMDVGMYGDIDGMSQISDKFSPGVIQKNGYPAGNLTSVEVNANGHVITYYDNGISRTIAQIPLVDVPNVNGVMTHDDQTYTLTREAGQMILWGGSEGPTGDIVSYAREESATDVAGELTSLIQTQRAYSSNAKVIQTVDEMLQETTNIKR